jgi:2-methylisocitrate lyase-like PEP mutase family enzyme
MNESSSLRHLHRPDHILILPNAWDAASARLFENAGAEAIATTSAGFAWANGYRDGYLLPTRVLLDGVAAIARVTKIPLTVDLEGGYSEDPAEVADLVRSLLGAARVDGINIEDGDAPPELLEDKIRSIRRAADASGAELFINARTDVYFRPLAAPEDALAMTMERAARYEAAGCDGLFVPGLTAPIEIARIVRATALPVNVLASRRLPDLERLRSLGVRRLSIGSAIALRAYGAAQQLAIKIVQQGPTTELFDAATLGYADMNDLLRPRA